MLKTYGQGLVDIQPADSTVAVSDNLFTHALTRGVYIGTSQSLDFYQPNNSPGGSQTAGWTTFQGLVSGTVLPLHVMGVRITSGGGAPTAGDVNFLY